MDEREKSTFKNKGGHASVAELVGHCSVHQKFAGLAWLT